jgi:hypothetical protein
MPEGIEAAGRIVDAYPNGGRDAGKGYLGALAATLVSYPRQTATACADRVHGITRTCKFLPTVADVVAWCERKTEPLWEMAERERRIAEQLAERDAPPPDPVMVDRIAQGFRELGETLRRGTMPSARQISAKAEKDKANNAKRLAEVYAEWGDQEAPTIGGIPVSRELVDTMRREAE